MCCAEFRVQLAYEFVVGRRSLVCRGVLVVEGFRSRENAYFPIFPYLSCYLKAGREWDVELDREETVLRQYRVYSVLRVKLVVMSVMVVFADAFFLLLPSVDPSEYPTAWRNEDVDTLQTQTKLHLW